MVSVQYGLCFFYRSVDPVLRDTSLICSQRLRGSVFQGLNQFSDRVISVRNHGTVGFGRNLCLFRHWASHYDCGRMERVDRFQDCYAAAVRRGRKLSDFRPQSRSWPLQPLIVAGRPGEAFSFRPAAIRGRARRTTLVRRSKLIRSLAPLPMLILQ